MQTLELLKSWLSVATAYTAIAIDAIALLIVIYGTFEVIYSGVKHALTKPSAHDLRTAWIRFGRWLVAPLTLQLAADIVETSIAPTWDEVGRLAMIAVIRTMLNFFLERDIDELKVRDQVNAEGDNPRSTSSLGSSLFFSF